MKHLSNQIPTKPIALVIALFLAVLIIIAIASIGAYVAPMIGVFATCVLSALLAVAVIFCIVLLCLIGASATV